MNTDFQNSLKQLTFKTIYHDQLTTVDYDRLFADQRVIVLSIPVLYFFESHTQMSQYKEEYENFTSNKIDAIYAISSFNPMIAAWADSNYKSSIIGLPDKDQAFVTALAAEVQSTKSIDFLAKRWEYVSIINNGNLEKLWQNPFPEHQTLRQYRYGYGYSKWESHGKVQDLGTLHYRKLGPATVLDYLRNSIDNSN